MPQSQACRQFVSELKSMVNATRCLRRHATALAVLCLVWLCFQSIATACPTCAEGMANDAHHANLIRGYFWSIVFMMSMPFLIFTAVCSYFYFEIRRARARQARGGAYASDAVYATHGRSGA